MGHPWHIVPENKRPWTHGSPMVHSAGPWVAYELSMGISPMVFHGFTVLPHVYVVSICHQPMGHPWVAHGSPMGRPWVSHGFTVLVYVSSMSYPWVFRVLAHAASMGLQCWPMGLPWVTHGLPIGLPSVCAADQWVSHGRPMTHPRVAHGSPMGYP